MSRTFLAAAAIAITAAISVPIALAATGDDTCEGRGAGDHGRHGPFQPPESVEEAAEHAGKMANHLADRIDADDTQRAALVAAFQDGAPTMFVQRQEGHELHEAMRTAMSNGADRTEVEALRAEIAAHMDVTSQLMVDQLYTVKDLLTDEQFATVSEMMEHAGPPMGGPHGPRGPRGPGGPSSR